MNVSTAIAELICRMLNVEFGMLNVRNSLDALAQPVAADSDNSTFNIYHSTFPMRLARPAPTASTALATYLTLDCR